MGPRRSVAREGPVRLSRRTLLRAAVAAGAGGVATGCTAAPAGTARVRVWTWLTGMNSYVAAFNAAQREVFVELNVIAAGLSGGYAQQTNAVRAHNAPDILHVEYQALPQILTTGGLRDLSGDVADLAAGCAPAAWRAVRPDGRTWGVPFDVAPTVLYYRKDLFDRHGIAVPRTWDEFRAAAAAVRQADPAARITTFPLNDGSFFAGMCWQAGDPWWRIDGDAWRVNIAGEGTLRTAEYWQRMIGDGLVAGTPVQTQDWIAAMHTGRLWCLLGASWSVGVFNRSIPQDSGRWAVTTMPTWDGHPANGMQGGTAFGVSAGSAAPEAAVTFLRWLATNPEVPRIGSRFTTPFPAYLPNRDVARGVYKGGYLLGDPVYDVLDEADRRVPEWTWGPTALGVFSMISDRLAGVRAGGTTLPDAIQRVHRAAVADMRGRGLSVVDGRSG